LDVMRTIHAIMNRNGIASRISGNTITISKARFIVLT